MTWGEALRLTHGLASDPTSHVAAAVNGWLHPWTWESMVLADLYDLTHTVAWRQGGGKGSRPKPYPRPVSADRRVAKSALTQEQTLAALRFAGHTNLPTAA